MRMPRSEGAVSPCGCRAAKKPSNRANHGEGGLRGAGRGRTGRARSRETGRSRVRTLARRQDIPQNFLENILTELRRAGIVRTRRGAEGGYQLARPAADVTVAEVLRAVEGPLAAVQGVRPDELAYGGAATDLPEVWVALRASLRDVLEHVTLADIARGKLPSAVKQRTRPKDRVAPALARGLVRREVDKYNTCRAVPRPRRRPAGPDRGPGRRSPAARWPASSIWPGSTAPAGSPCAGRSTCCARKASSRSRRGAGWFAAVDPVRQPLGRVTTVEAAVEAAGARPGRRDPRVRLRRRAGVDRRRAAASSAAPTCCASSG